MNSMNNQNKPMICGIVAIGPDNVIGRDGKMPWYSKQDFYHFKNTTIPWPCVFGRTTFDGLPRKPLPNRLNIVCGSGYNNEYIDGCFYASSLENAIKECSNSEKIFICGGAALYKYAMGKNLIDIMYLTKIHSDDLLQQIKRTPKAFTRFPFDINIFFDDNQWISKQIFYDTDKLPTEYENITSNFFKCVCIHSQKIRQIY